MLNLTELQQDSLTELLNMGIGRAAAALSQMVQEEIQLSVPLVKILSRSEALHFFQSQTSQRIAAVRQSFTGPFWGDAFLLFPEQKSLALVRALLKDAVPLENMTDLEQETFMEVGNIVLNACLGSLANFLHSEIRTGLPLFLQGFCTEILDANNYPYFEEETVLFLRVDFILPKSALHGYVIFVVEGNAIEALTEKIDQFLQQI